MIKQHIRTRWILLNAPGGTLAGSSNSAKETGGKNTSIGSKKAGYSMSIPWEKTTEEKFKHLIAKTPVFLRPIAESRVSQKAQDIAAKAQHPEITEKDMVDAFFSETPFGFQGLIKNDLKDLGIDYTQYGYTK